MDRQCEEADFKRDTATHEMSILKDEGLYRHLRFKRPGSYTFCFDIVTWPGYLSITGDMGCYVFSRIEDMIYFFSGEHINPYYWSEKMQAVNTKGSNTYHYKQWSGEKFLENLQKHFNGRHTNAEDAVKEFEAFKESSSIEYIETSDEYEAIAFIREHTCELLDFSEYDNTVYTYHYIWCCWALRWGANTYLKTKGDPVDG